MSEYVTEVEWEKITVRAESGITVAQYGFYKAWKTGHPGLVGYGITLNAAIAAMLNKFGE